VAISGTTALVGAPGWYSMDGAQPWPYAEGVAYFYSYQDLEVGTDYPGWQWVETAEIGDPASTAYDHFGTSAALSADASTGLVGEPSMTVGDAKDVGAAYTFGNPDAGWTQQPQLTASDAAANGGFGFAVALSGDKAVIGGDGAAYIFANSGSGWEQQAELTNPDTSGDTSFGLAVALDGDTALIGAPWVTVNGQSAAGGAYAFTASDSTWTPQPEFTAYDAAADADFGSAVAISDDTALIGAPFKTVDGQSSAGAVYIDQVATP
jgi:hypothetical protein